jgi:hypothetical protein
MKSFRTDGSLCRSADTANAVRKALPVTMRTSPALVSVEAKRTCIPIENSEILLEAVYKYPNRVLMNKSVFDLMGFRNKSVSKVI